MDEKQFKQLTDMIRNIRYEVLDVKVRLQELEMHLTRQDEAGREILEASRRLMISIEAIDDAAEGVDFDDEDDIPLQN